MNAELAGQLKKYNFVQLVKSCASSVKRRHIEFIHLVTQKHHGYNLHKSGGHLQITKNITRSMII